MINFIVSLFSKEDIKKYAMAGAKSVLVGVEFFSARSVHDFQKEELKEIHDICKENHMNMYVLVNRMFMEEELDILETFLLLLKDIDVEGIYFGDECVLSYGIEMGIVDKLIYAPDTLMCNHLDVQYYLDEGIQMVCLSKDLSLEELCQIQKKVNGDCEIIIHGRVNIMHSKRNLLSSYFNFLHRQEDIKNDYDLYLMEENRDEHMPIIEDDLGTHVFSGYTLASFEELPIFIDSGIHNFRIDGIFHDVDYVLEALCLYQNVIKGWNGSEIMKDYMQMYEDDHVTHGCYNRKSSKVKED